MNKIYRISYSLAKNLIEKNHYSHKMPQAVKYSFGCYHNKNLIGVCVISIPSNYHATTCLFNNEKNIVLELSRYWSIDDVPKNFNSYCLSRIFKWLTIKSPYDILIPYSDTTFGHSGALYKALNGYFLGETKPETRYFYKGQYITRRGLGRKQNETEKQSVDKILSDGAIKTVSKPKNKFLWFICYKNRKKELLKKKKFNLCYWFQKSN